MLKTRGYGEWSGKRGFMTSGAAKVIGMFIQSLKEYPPSQPSDSFKLSDVFEKLSANPAN